MIIKDNQSSNRILSSLEESFTSNLPIITRYLWKLGIESKSLQLLVDEGNGSSFSIELDGELFLDFGVKRCLSCGETIQRTSSQAICEVCKESLHYKCRRCIFEGPGIPFNSICTPENPPCKLDYMCSKCWSDHYLYLGRFGNNIKVGTSNCQRKEGKYYRLIEQGLDEALVLSKFQSLQEVLSVETQIAEMFNLTTFFTFADKVDLLQKPEITNECDLHLYLSKLERLFPDITFSFVDLTDVWQKLPSNSLIRKISFSHSIRGTVKASRGNILFVQPFDNQSSENILYAYNLSHLVGCELLIMEE